MAAIDMDGAGDDLLDLEPVEPVDSLHFLFTTNTVAGARAFAAALEGRGEVWELNGRYYPVRRNSDEARLLRRRGAEVVPPDDDALHMILDPLLSAMQRADAGGEPDSE